MNKAGGLVRNISAMTVSDLFNSDFIVLPLARDSDDFPGIIFRKKLQTYLTFINQLDGRLSDEIKERIEVIRNLCYGLIASIEEYYLGHVNKSYLHFKESVERIKSTCHFNMNLLFTMKRQHKFSTVLL